MSIQSGCDIKTVQENLGHYAAVFTLDTYAHVLNAHKIQGMALMENLYYVPNNQVNQYEEDDEEFL